MTAWLQISKAHIWRNLWSQPPACKQTQPSSHYAQRREFMDGERLTVPASSSRLSELELKSWERKGEGGSYSARAGEEQDKNTKLHSARSFQHPRLQACGMLFHVYLWILMWLGLIPESYSDVTRPSAGGEDTVRDYRTHRNTIRHTWPNARLPCLIYI